MKYLQIFQITNLDGALFPNLAGARFPNRAGALFPHLNGARFSQSASGLFKSSSKGTRFSNGSSSSCLFNSSYNWESTLRFPQRKGVARTGLSKACSRLPHL